MDNKLKTLVTRMPKGMPLTSARLAGAGVSADLAVRYERNGWLTRLARGVYQRVGDPLELHPTLRMLEAQVTGLHVGGKTAFDWYRVRHYVAQRPVLRLYGCESWRPPAWLTRRFPADYHRKRLFRESPEALLGVSRLNGAAEAPLTSEPERALLEILSDVGSRQPREVARKLAEMTHTLRRDASSAEYRRPSHITTTAINKLRGRVCPER